MSSKLHHGEEPYDGYQLVTPHYKEKLMKNGMSKEEADKYLDGTIIAVDENGNPQNNIKSV